MNDWSTPEDIRKRIRREWDNGCILAAMLGGEAVFPLRVPLRRPDSKALAEHFEGTRLWIAALGALDKEQAGNRCRLEWQEVVHRQLGRNRIPVAAIVESEKDGLGLIGKQSDADRFRELTVTVADAFPSLTSWMRQYPLKVLDQAENWPRLLAVLDWVAHHPDANVYLRQIDAPGVDTKFIEQHRGLLCDLLDRVLPQERMDNRYSGVRGFEQRYGFKRKPALVRFRFLDRKQSLHGLPDVAVTSDEFARLALPVERVFITENEINFLSFPEVTDGLMLFGGGYGFEHISQTDWLRQREIFYWGDIDTHGFAILDQLRSQFPAVRSLMMDRATLLEHRAVWGNEDRPTFRQLERLNAEESALFDDLRFDCISPSLRLEQERIGFAWINAELERVGLK